MKKLCSTCGGVIFAIGVLTAPDISTTVCKCREEETPAHTHTESPITITEPEIVALSATGSVITAGVIIKRINEEIDKLKT